MILVSGAPARAQRSPRAIGAGVALALAALLAALVVAMVQRLDWNLYATHLAARDWPVAEATVLDVSLERRSTPTAGGVTQVLHLTGTYRYAVDGAAFDSGSISLRPVADLPERHVQTLYARLNFARLTGRPVVVHYDPDTPGHAFFDISVDHGRLLWPALIGAGVLAFAAGAVWIVARRQVHA